MKYQPTELLEELTIQEQIECEHDDPLNYLSSLPRACGRAFHRFVGEAGAL